MNVPFGHRKSNDSRMKAKAYKLNVCRLLYVLTLRCVASMETLSNQFFVYLMRFGFPERGFYFGAKYGKLQ